LLAKPPLSPRSRFSPQHAPSLARCISFPGNLQLAVYVRKHEPPSVENPAVEDSDELGAKRLCLLVGFYDALKAHSTDVVARHKAALALGAKKKLIIVYHNPPLRVSSPGPSRVPRGKLCKARERLGVPSWPHAPLAFGLQTRWAGTSLGFLQLPTALRERMDGAMRTVTQSCHVVGPVPPFLVL
jgi:hypothetical protein